MNNQIKTSAKQEVVTFGCRLNIYESEIIRKNLQLSNLDNVVVFNTCAVTKEAEKQAKQAIRKARRNNPKVKIIVTGCAAQNKPELFANMQEVDKIIGNEEKLSPLYYNFNQEKIIVNDIMTIKETAGHFVESFTEHSRAFLQIQNGCDHRCTFCIIPYGRGNSRSVPIGVIVNQIQKLIHNGFNEVVLTGVDLTAYGADLPGKPTLAQMVKRVLNLIPDLHRLRLSSIDVAEIDEELFDAIAYNHRIMPHLHISLQSGDNMILKRMKRRHNREQVIDFCTKLRSLRTNIAFGADIIAGFPTESDVMFENTKQLILEADLQYLHIFPYSEREGTPAVRMPQVEKNIRKERAAILRELGQKQVQKFFTKNLQHNTKLLIESNNTARTENFIPVKFVDHTEYNAGDIVNAQLIAIDNDSMIAKPIN